MGYRGVYITPDHLLRYVVVTDDGVGAAQWASDATTFDSEAVARFTASMARYVIHGDPGEDRRTFSAVVAH
jgi:hypothetical protein